MELKQDGVFTPVADASNQRGFTLIEVMIVIVIIGVVSSIAIPAFSEWRDKQAVRSASPTLMSHLKQARVIAIAENRGVTIDFTSTTTYTYDTGVCGTCKNLQVNLNQYGNVVFNPAPADRTFTSRGTVKNLSADTMMTLQAGSASKTITLNLLGRVYY